MKSGRMAGRVPRSVRERLEYQVVPDHLLHLLLAVL